VLFLIDEIFQQRWLKSFIQLEIINVVDISFSLIIFNYDEFSRFRYLFEKRVVNIVLQKINVKDEMNVNRVK
jgi:hypothetical protein